MNLRDRAGRHIINFLMRVFLSKTYRTRLALLIERGMHPPVTVVVTTAEGVEHLRNEGKIPPGPESNMGDHDE